MDQCPSGQQCCAKDGQCQSVCCPAGKIACGGTCIDRCAEGEECSNGRCCLTGKTACNEQCIDTSNDMANCGACGKTCDKKACETCVGGECIKPEPDPCNPCNPDTGKPEAKCSAEKDPKAPDCANGNCVCGSAVTCNDGGSSRCCTDIFYRPDGSRAGCCCNGRTRHPASGAEICYPCGVGANWCYCNGGIGGSWCFKPGNPIDRQCPTTCTSL
ncbi:MAG: hypothetical protein U0031_17545 [Thermomicrobiales bacterium]